MLGDALMEIVKKYILKMLKTGNLNDSMCFYITLLPTHIFFMY